MRNIKNERVLFVFIKIIPFLINKIRNKYYNAIFSCCGIKVGKQLSFSGTKRICVGNYVVFGNQNWIDAIDDGIIEIGNYVSFSQNVHVAAKQKVIINDGCLIGSDVLITDHDHSFDEKYFDLLPKKRPLKIKGNTVLGENVWLGDNVKILSGVILGDNVVVAANAVVTKSFPSGSVIGGIPANYIHKKK
ncbi:DapH/DapD/GlmU-related protein [Pectobacterium polaris]|uniref:DapH/DapD/GlmU-related protein n=1 Tax=Pectobacterium polaris TaxID=2042057 RepID=UPI002277A5E0|nr:DapH/DapD/GlmU-related protein [Pectobacterium polaris]